MQRCENCGSQFSWGMLYQSFMSWMYQPIICPKCDAEHKITFPSRFVFILLGILPGLIVMYSLSPSTPLVATLIVGLLIMMLGSLLTPFFIKYKLT